MKDKNFCIEDILDEIQGLNYEIKKNQEETLDEFDKLKEDIVYIKNVIEELIEENRNED